MFTVKTLRHSSSRSAGQAAARRRYGVSHCPLRLEALESRLLLAVFDVTSLADSGAGTLRSAISQANGLNEASQIRMKVAGTIAVGSQTSGSWFQDILQPMTIDGTTAPGYDPSQPPVVIIDGSQVKGINQDAFDILASATVVRGFEIRNFGHYGIYIYTGGFVKIQGNWIHANGYHGIGVQGGYHHLIGGDQPGDRNVISGNGAAGIGFQYGPGSNHEVIGNYIGTTPSGAGADPNAWGGISIGDGSDSITIGGTTPEARNVISGNKGAGIGISGAGTGDTRIYGNYVGIDATGEYAVPNESGGISVSWSAPNTRIGGDARAAANVVSGNIGVGISESGIATLISGNLIGTDATGTKAVGNTAAGVSISGKDTLLRAAPDDHFPNVISGNGGNGVEIGQAADHVEVTGDYIGTDVSGTARLANAYNGIILWQSSEHRVGGLLPEQRNVISGNKQNGISIAGGVLGNVVQGNYIGTTADGNGPLGNSSNGVLLTEGTDYNAIKDNLISANGAAGVRIDSANTSLNMVTGNTIGSNVSRDEPWSLWNHDAAVRIEGASGNYVGYDVEDGGNYIDAGLADAVVVSQGTGNGIYQNTFNVRPEHLLYLPIRLIGGGNEQMSSPTLMGCDRSAGQIVVTGKLESFPPNTTFVIQYYGRSLADYRKGLKGGIYLGKDTAVTSPAGNAIFTSTLPPADVFFIYATATDPDKNTSEFSFSCGWLAEMHSWGSVPPLVPPGSAPGMQPPSTPSPSPAGGFPPVASSAFSAVAPEQAPQALPRSRSFSVYARRVHEWNGALDALFDRPPTLTA
jgi:hypothetical protein